MDGPLPFEFENRQNTLDDLRELILKEVALYNPGMDGEWTQPAMPPMPPMSYDLVGLIQTESMLLSDVDDVDGEGPQATSEPGEYRRGPSLEEMQDAMDEEMPDEEMVDTYRGMPTVPDMGDHDLPQRSRCAMASRPPQAYRRNGAVQLDHVFETRSRTLRNAGLGRTQSAPAHISPPLKAMGSPARPKSHRLPAICDWEASFENSRQDAVQQFIDLTVGAVAPPSSPAQVRGILCDKAQASAQPVGPAEPACPASLPRLCSMPQLQRLTTDPYMQRCDESMRLKRRRSDGHQLPSQPPRRQWTRTYLTRSSPDGLARMETPHIRTPSPQRPSPVQSSAHSSQMSSPCLSSPSPPEWTRYSSSDEMEMEQEYRPPTPKQPPRATSPSLKSIFVSDTGCETPIANAFFFCHTSVEAINNYGQETYNKEGEASFAVCIILLMVLAAISACFFLQLLCWVSDGFCPDIDKIVSTMFASYT